MKVLWVAPSFYPATAFGGPIQVTLDVVRAEVMAGVDCHVLTTDTAGQLTGERLSRELVKASGLADKVTYARKVYGNDASLELLYRLPARIRWADVVHLSAVYSFPTLPTLFLARLFGKPVVWSLHGALLRWQKNRRSIMKWLWERVCGALINPSRACLHVTSVEEARAARQRMPGIETVLIPWGVEIPTFTARTPGPQGVPRLMFLGRLDPIKGLENLLAALVQSRDRYNLCPKLAIYGDGDPKYQAQLQQLIDEYSLQSAVEMRGHLAEEHKRTAFAEADVLVLPSHTENFGMVVAEALAHAVPVIASMGTPWAELEKRGCGLWVSNAPEALANAIRRIAHMDMPAMGMRGRDWMMTEFSWKQVTKTLVAVYEELIRGSKAIKGRRAQ